MSCDLKERFSFDSAGDEREELRNIFHFVKCEAQLSIKIYYAIPANSASIKTNHKISSLSRNKKFSNETFPQPIKI